MTAPSIKAAPNASGLRESESEYMHIYAFIFYISGKALSLSADLIYGEEDSISSSTILTDMV